MKPATRRARAKKPPLLRQTPWKFAQHGESGRWVSELFPHVAQHVDDLCVINSMYTEGRAHGEATLRLHTGTANFVRPSLGSWVTYGLGTENSNLPGFITIAPPRAHGGVQNYSSAFLPAIYQGTAIGTADVPVKDASIPFLSNDKLSRAMQRRQLDLIQQLNHSHLRRSEDDAQIEGMVQSYELGFRMQSAAPSVLELTRESEATLATVRHRNPRDRRLRPAMPAGPSFRRIRRTFHPDLHRVPLGPARETGERTRKNRQGRRSAHLRSADRSQGPRAAGRHARLLGRRIRTNAVHRRNRRPRPQPRGVFRLAGRRRRQERHCLRRTDEFGFAAVENKVHYHDLHATILYLLGLDHERLTYRYSGRDFRLTDVYGRVVHDILA